MVLIWIYICLNSEQIFLCDIGTDLNRNRAVVAQAVPGIFVITDYKYIYMGQGWSRKTVTISVIAKKSIIYHLFNLYMMIIM